MKLYNCFNSRFCSLNTFLCPLRWLCRDRYSHRSGRRVSSPGTANSFQPEKCFPDRSNMSLLFRSSLLCPARSAGQIPVHCGTRSLQPAVQAIDPFPADRNRRARPRHDTHRRISDHRFDKKPNFRPV